VKDVGTNDLLVLRLLTRIIANRTLKHKRRLVTSNVTHGNKSGVA
jgi:hypothetical protein